MRQIRVNSAAGIDFMKDKLLPDSDFTGDQLAELLKVNLTNEPNNTYILQVWNETEVIEEPELVGFIVALAPKNQQHVFLLQAWIAPKQDPLIADRLWLAVILWTLSLGKDEVRAETLRNPEAFFKRWNFSTYSTIMSFHVSPDFQKNLLNHSVMVGKEMLKEKPDSSERELSSETEKEQGENEELEAGNRDDASADGDAAAGGERVGDTDPGGTE